MKRKWPDWSNGVLGAWIFISPLILEPTTLHDSAMSGAGMTLRTWNFFAVGAAIAVLALSGLIAFRRWKEWAMFGLGGWLFFSPWILGFHFSVLPMANAIISGALSALIAGAALVIAEGPGDLPPAR